VDGSCDAVHGYRKVARDRASRYPPNGRYFNNPGNRSWYGSIAVRKYTRGFVSKDKH